MAWITGNSNSLLLYDVSVEGAVACGQNSVNSTRFLQKGLGIAGGYELDTSVMEQLIRHRHMNHVTAVGFSSERHWLLKAAI